MRLIRSFLGFFMVFIKLVLVVNNMSFKTSKIHQVCKQQQARPETLKYATGFGAIINVSLNIRKDYNLENVELPPSYKQEILILLKVSFSKVFKSLNGLLWVILY